MGVWWERYATRDAKGQYHCRAEGCTYLSDSPNAVQLHYTRTHVPREKAALKPTRPPVSGQHQHRWRLLDPRNPMEARAIRVHGMTKICMECEEVE